MANTPDHIDVDVIVDDWGPMFIAAIEGLAVALKSTIALINVLIDEITIIRAEASERHTNWFSDLSDWRRIVHIMAIGAYLEKR